LVVKGTDVGQINELEFIRGEIWANVYQSGLILRISPETGNIIGRVDLSELPYPEERNGNEDVLNGIAYDAEGERIFVTGKNYSYVYQIRISEDGGG
jgi:glutamine cyclotransferase